jgi:formylglycine-generating enzyme required for sulfatase activity
VQLAPGTRPHPEYELVERLGRGGFGEVWKAKGPGGFPVALKFIRLEDRAGTVEQRALQLVQEVRHINVLGQFGSWQRDGYLIIATELAERTLLDRLHEAVAQGLPGIPRKELLEYMREAAKGLDYLDGKGLQHRDVKPANFLLVGGGVKLADFGLAKLLERTQATSSGGMTPAYAAPELFHNQISRRTDQYALAVSYYQLRTNRLLYDGLPANIMAGHLLLAPDLSALPEGERPALARALAKKPEERWPSCRAFVEALAAGAAGHAAASTAPAKGKPPQAPRRGPAHVRPAARDSFTQVPSKRTRKEAGALRHWRGTRGVVAAGFVGLGLLATLVLLSALWPGQKPTGRRASKENPASQVKPGLERNAPPAPEPPKKDPPPVPVVQPAPVPVRLDPETGLPVEMTSSSLGMKLVLIPAGRFRMGSPEDDPLGENNEKPQHEVEISKPFYMGVYTVTVGEFRKFVEEANYRTGAETDGRGGSGYNATSRTFENPKPEYNWKHVGWEQGDRHPVVNVTWNDAVRFCEWLSRKEGKMYELPTEAEWEYACRAGTTTRTYQGDESKVLREIANLADDSLKAMADTSGIRIEPWDDGYPFTAPVGQFKPNAWGLYDMLGNAQQWCADRRSGYTHEFVRDPKGPAKGDRMIRRNANWASDARDCRAAMRMTLAGRSDRSAELGFRVVCRPAPRDSE